MQKHYKRLGITEGLLSAFLNLGLFTLKLWTGTRMASVAMVADAWHTLSDIMTSIVVIVGFWIAGRPRDREHPFGHGRAELIGSIVIGTLLVVVGVNFLRDSYLQIRERTAVYFSLMSMIVFALSAVMKEGLAQFSIRTGKKIESRSLIADGWHHRSDAIASAAIVVGAVVGRNFWWMDGALGFGVSLLILYAAFVIVRDAARVFMGEAAGSSLENKIRDLIHRVAPQITDIHHIHIHRYGTHIEVTLHTRLPAETHLHDSHDIISRVEEALRVELKLEPTVHMEPDVKQ